MSRKRVLEKELHYWRDEITAKWPLQMWIVTSGFYLLAFIIGVIQIYISPSVSQLSISPLFLVTGLGLYTVARVFYLFHWHKGDMHIRTVMGTDMATCV